MAAEALTFRGDNTLADILARVVAGVNRTYGTRFTVTNGGNENPILTDIALAGDAWSQIGTLCQSVGVNWTVENDDVVFWSRKQPRRTTRVIELSARNGLIGYPVIGPSDVTINALYQPGMDIGRLVRITIQLDCPIPKLTGYWQPFVRTIALDAEVPDGPGTSRCSARRRIARRRRACRAATRPC